MSSKQLKDLNALLSDAAYEKTSAGIQNYLSRNRALDGWKLDQGLSADKVKVFVNAQTHQTIISVRGTDFSSPDDLFNDALIIAGTERHGSRYKAAQQVLEKVQQSGLGGQISMTGHSLGGRIAIDLAKDYQLDATVFNPGTGPAQLVQNVVGVVAGDPTTVTRNITSYTSGKDPISMLSFLDPDARSEPVKQISSNAHTLDNYTHVEYDSQPIVDFVKQIAETLQGTIDITDANYASYDTERPPDQEPAKWYTDNLPEYETVDVSAYLLNPTNTIHWTTPTALATEAIAKWTANTPEAELVGPPTKYVKVEAPGLTPEEQANRDNLLKQRLDEENKAWIAKVSSQEFQDELHAEEEALIKIVNANWLFNPEGQRTDLNATGLKAQTDLIALGEDPLKPRVLTQKDIDEINAKTDPNRMVLGYFDAQGNPVYMRAAEAEAHGLHGQYASDYTWKDVGDVAKTVFQGVLDPVALNKKIGQNMAQYDPDNWQIKALEYAGIVEEQGIVWAETFLSGGVLGKLGQAYAKGKNTVRIGLGFTTVAEDTAAVSEGAYAALGDGEAVATVASEGASYLKYAGQFGVSIVAESNALLGGFLQN